MAKYLVISFFFLSVLSHALDQVKVGVSPVLSSAGIYLAQDLGYFSEQGIKVTLVEFPASGAGMTALLASNNLDVGGGNITAGLYNAILKGEKFKIVADKGHVSLDRDYLAFIVRSSHIQSGRFKTLKDIKGFKIGLTSLDGVSQQIVVDRILKKTGLTDKDVKYIKCSYAEMNLALRTGEIDAAVQIEPFLFEAVAGGFAKKIISTAEVYPGQQSAGIFFSEDFMVKRSRAAIGFLAAYLKAVRLYNQSFKDLTVQSVVVKSLGKHLKISPENWSQLRPVGLSDDGTVLVQSLKEDLAWYVKQGYVSRELQISQVLDVNLIKRAQAKLNGVLQ